MATTERHRVYYDHIVQVWLNPDPDSNDILCLLRGENKTNLRLLKTFCTNTGVTVREYNIRQ